jgi:type IV secretory pathway VirB6-like protein
MIRCILQVVVVVVVIIIIIVIVVIVMMIIKFSRLLTQTLNNSSVPLHVHCNIAFHISTIYSPPSSVEVRIGGAVTLLRLHAFKAWTGITLTFFTLSRIIHITAANNTNTTIRVSKAVQIWAWFCPSSHCDNCHTLSRLRRNFLAPSSCLQYSHS